MGGTNQNFERFATANRRPVWAETSRDWAGRGRVRGVQDDGAVRLRIAGLTTQARRYRALAAEFFRKTLKVRPNFTDAYVVDIIVET